MNYEDQPINLDNGQQWTVRIKDIGEFIVVD